MTSLLICFGGPQIALVSLAMENEGVIVPGYTHMQRAQPVLLQHHLLVYVEQVSINDLTRNTIICLDTRSLLFKYYHN